METLAPIQPYLPPPQLMQSRQNDQVGTKCEIRQYERVVNSKGEKVLLRSGTSRASLNNRPRDEWSANSALLLIKELGDEECPRTELEIQSPYMKAALKECVPEFKHIDIDQKSVIISEEPRCLFHFRQQLIDYHKKMAETGERDSASHVQYLLDYMFNTLSSEIRHFNQLMDNPVMQPALAYLNLWMAFIPGELIYVEKKRGHPNQRGRLMRLLDMNRCPCQRTWCSRYWWTINGLMIDYDGTDFGHTKRSVRVEPYEGVKALQDLAVVPLQYHQDSDSIRESLIPRGKKFVELHQRHYRQYKGVAHLLGDIRDSTFIGEDDYFPLRSTHVNGRVMIDCDAFSEARPSHQPYLLTSEKIFRTQLGQHLKMEEEEYMICAEASAGYSLSDKKWGWFRVEAIENVEFNAYAFESLILQQNFKDMLLALVKSHESTKNIFDDVIKGKGKGLVFLLHGDPGTGKTLTAESVADYTKMPLLKLDVASVGASMTEVEQNLFSIFRLAERWNAIILLDEADVFLERRKLSDLDRNRQVATFLRAVEYFAGILFLTSNRTGSFDRAFKSRIHLALYYPKLNLCSRSKIWKSLLSQPKLDVDPEIFRDEMMDSIAVTELNGRQIKNVVQMALALATSQGCPIAKHHLSTALEAMKTFESDSAGLDDRDEDIRQFEETSHRILKRKRITENEQPEEESEYS